MIDLVRRRYPVSVADDLETNLEKLLAYGRPRVGYFSGSGNAGWRCSIEMNTSGIAGCTFECASDFGLSTANLAVVQCLSRTMDAVARAGALAK